MTDKDVPAADTASQPDATAPQPDATAPSRTTAAKRGPGMSDRLDALQARTATTWNRRVDAVRGTTMGRWWQNTTAPGRVDWFLLAAMGAVAYVTFLYGDVRATFEHSFNFLDSVFQGRPQDFYQIAIENSAFGHPAVYDIPIYLVFGLWNLPSYLAHVWFDYDALNSLPAQLWLKAMMVVFTLIAAKLVFEIAKTLGLSVARSKWATFYFLSAVTLLVPVLVIVQYDIISVAFMLAGILAYMKGRTRSFLLWFLAANTFKLFSVFVFIPLVLLREKRLPRAAAQIIVGLLGLAFCRLLYSGNLAYITSTNGFTDQMLQRLLVSGFSWHSSIGVPIFVVFLIGVVVFSYAKKVHSDRELQVFAIYLPLAVFLAFCALVPLNPYWMVLVSPFAALIIFINPRHLTLNSMLEVGIGTCLVLIYSMVGFSMYNNGVFDQLLFGRVVSPASPQRFETPQQILEAVGLTERIPFLVGFLVAATIAVLVLNYPRAQLVADMPNAEPVRRSVVWVRLAAPAAFMALLFAFYLVPGRPTVFSTETTAPVNGTVSVVAAGSVTQQVFRVDETVDVHSIGIGFDASAVTWINSAVVDITVTDPGGATVFTTKAPVNGLKVGVATFGTPGLTLEQGVDYTLTLTGQNDEGEPVFVQLNPAVDNFVTTQDGEPIAGDLVLVIVAAG